MIISSCLGGLVPTDLSEARPVTDWPGPALSEMVGTDSTSCEGRAIDWRETGRLDRREPTDCARRVEKPLQVDTWGG